MVPGSFLLLKSRELPLSVKKIQEVGGGNRQRAAKINFRKYNSWEDMLWEISHSKFQPTQSKKWGKKSHPVFVKYGYTAKRRKHVSTLHS